MSSEYPTGLEYFLSAGCSLCRARAFFFGSKVFMDAQEEEKLQV
jgi:hypothetical protein